MFVIELPEYFVPNIVSPGDLLLSQRKNLLKRQLSLVDEDNSALNNADNAASDATFGLLVRESSTKDIAEKEDEDVEQNTPKLPHGFSKHAIRSSVSADDFDPSEEPDQNKEKEME